MDYYARRYCLGGRWVCLDCQTQRCRRTDHQLIYLGPKFRIPKKHNQRVWNKIKYQVKTGQIKPHDFYAPAVEYREYKELYSDIPRHNRHRNRSIYPPIGQNDPQI